MESSEILETGSYSMLDSKGKEIASQIEKLLIGLSVGDADYLLHQVRKQFLSNVKIK